MIVHQLLEVLLSQYRADPLDPKNIKASIVGINDAVKFEVRGDQFGDDKIADYAETLLFGGLLRLPFELCYFEVQSCVVDPALDGTLCFWAADMPEDDRFYVESHFKGLDGWHSRVARAAVVYRGEKLGIVTDKSAEDWEQSNGSIAASVVASIIAFMDLKETKRETVTVKPRVNAHRIAQGKPPLHGHTVLTISKAAREALRVKGDAAMIVRRAHWRRGHLRHLHDKIVPVAPALVRGEGFVSKDYRI